MDLLQRIRVFESDFVRDFLRKVVFDLADLRGLVRGVMQAFLTFFDGVNEQRNLRPQEKSPRIILIHFCISAGRFVFVFERDTDRHLDRFKLLAALFDLLLDLSFLIDFVGETWMFSIR